jgi:hypothetical protein
MRGLVEHSSVIQRRVLTAKGCVLFDEGCDFLGSTFAQVLELVSMKIFLVALKYWRITGKPNLKQQNSQVT